jgi:pimeloyl-ACP methyl ester carboxylesterase
LYDHASDFLAALESERRLNQPRPLILVAHSLGGLLVKEMLRRSRGYDKQSTLRGIYDSTIGIIFFGTPHGGADPRSVARQIITSFAKTIGFNVNNRIVEALFPSAEYLKQLLDEFRRMVIKQERMAYSVISRTIRITGAPRQKGMISLTG